MVEARDRCDGKANRESSQEEDDPIRKKGIWFVVYVVCIGPFAGIERVADLRHRQPAGDSEEERDTDEGPHHVTEQ